MMKTTTGTTSMEELELDLG